MDENEDEEELYKNLDDLRDLICDSSNDEKIKRNQRKSTNRRNYYIGESYYDSEMASENDDGDDNNNDDDDYDKEYEYVDSDGVDIALLAEFSD